MAASARIASFLEGSILVIFYIKLYAATLNGGLWYIDRRGGVKPKAARKQSEGRTLEETGAILTVTRERVRQIEEKAIVKLQNGSARDIANLRDYAAGELDLVIERENEDPLQAPISTLTLELRTINSLAESGKKYPALLTVHDLLTASIDDILNRPNVARKTVVAIWDSLVSIGLIPEWEVPEDGGS